MKNIKQIGIRDKFCDTSCLDRPVLHFFDPAILVSGSAIFDTGYAGMRKALSFGMINPFLQSNDRSVFISALPESKTGKIYNIHTAYFVLPGGTNPKKIIQNT